MIAQFIDGPLWYFSSIVFVLGVLYRIFSVSYTHLRAHETHEVISFAVFCV